jgi:conjugative element/phage-associated large polyvalent protein
MTTDTLPATVKDAAAAIRKDLKAAFPGVKFSIRMATGTASSAWIDITWADGPNDDMVRGVTDRYEEFGSPLDGVYRERNLSTATLLAAQEKIRTILPDFTAYDADGRYVYGDCPIFHLGGWRFGGGSAYSALAEVADLLILNPRTGPGA